MIPSVKYNIQKRIGFTMMIILSILAIVNFFVGIFIKNIAPLVRLIDPNVSLLVFFAILSYSTTIKENKISQLIQIGMFFVTGIVSIIINDPNSLTQVNLIVFGIILCLQYDFLKKNFVFKVAIILIIYAILQILIEYIKNPVTFLNNTLQAIIYAAFYFYLVWIAFAEEINEYIRETRSLKTEMNKNEVFVSFGKNVSGVTHNLKNKLMAIQSYNEIIEETDDKEVKKYCRQQNEIINQTISLIESLTYAVKARQDNEVKVISLSKVIQSVVDLFNSNSKFHKDVIISTDLDENDFIKIAPLDASQLLENLIRNSWEAIDPSGEMKIDIKTARLSDVVNFTISDNGTGIPFCSQCNKKICIGCKEFKIGKSSKKTGSGIGMIYIHNLLKTIDAKLNISSRIEKPTGTKIEIQFPAMDENKNYLID